MEENKEKIEYDLVIEDGYRLRRIVSYLFLGAFAVLIGSVLFFAVVTLLDLA